MKKLVIVGGGFAGSTIAEKLQRKFDVTLIDTKPYFEFTPGILRTIAHPTRERCMQYEHKKYLQRAEFIVGNVKEIGPGFIKIKGKRFGYDYLVIATGSSYKEPFKHPQLFVASRAKELSKYHHKLQKAESALIIGGGLVGVELAAEIAYYFPGVHLTVVNMKTHLLDRMPSKARRYARDFLKKRNIKIIFGEKVVRHENQIFVTDKGRRIKTDIAFNCGGISPNSGIVRKFDGKVDERGFVKVDEFLRLRGRRNIFVAGDVTGIIEEKTAQNAEKHANTVVNNIKATEKGHELIAYQSKKRPIVLSLGPYNGILVNKDFVMTGLIPAFLKWAVEKREILKRRF